jgi:DNA replication licensing factor MCM4
MPGSVPRTPSSRYNEGSDAPVYNSDAPYRPRRELGTPLRTPLYRSTPVTPGSAPRRDPGLSSEHDYPAPGTGSGDPTSGGHVGSSGGPYDPFVEQNEKVWGAPFTLRESYERCARFLLEFVDRQTGEHLYLKVLEEGVHWDLPCINFNAEHMNEFDPVLYSWVIKYPGDTIPMLDMTINNIRAERHPECRDRRRIQMRPYALVDQSAMRRLDPSSIDTLVSVRGMVVRCGSLIPELYSALFKCSACSAEVSVEVERAQITEPAACGTCNRRRTMQLIHNRNSYTDKQMIKVQETPEEIPDGETPHTITVFAFDDLVDSIKPGDRVEITGIFRAQPVRVNPRRRTLRSVFRSYVDVLHFKKIATHSIGADSADQAAAMALAASNANAGDTAAATASAAARGPGGSYHDTHTLQSVRERLEGELRELARDRNIYNRLVKSLAPSIYRMEDVKKGILCLLFGGTNAGDGASQGKFRGELNVLLCGDPGTSKSQLLQYVHKIAPRGIYTSGKGSSAVGLTAYITHDPVTRELVLESGALVLSDRGVCCIDEFDKMSDTTRAMLHEVMEQQTVSIAKAGIVCTLNARTSILASANPKQSRYNPRLSVVENIELGPTLLSRFDLIYLILDQPNAADDLQLARHLIAMYYADRDEVRRADDIIPTQTLAHYISYARRNVHPELDDDAARALSDAYVELRERGNMSNRRIVTATPRQLESLIRLAEALARMRLSPVVTRWEVDEAKRLMQVATQATATDATTGCIDMSILTTGVSSADRERAQEQAPDVVERCTAFLRAQQTRKMTVARFRAICMDPPLRLTGAVINLLIEQLTFEKIVTKDGNMLTFASADL